MSHTECQPRILRLKQVQDRIGLGRSSIYNLQNPKSASYDASFPKSIKLGRNAVGWLESGINQWITSRESTVVST